MKKTILKINIIEFFSLIFGFVQLTGCLFIWLLFIFISVRGTSLSNMILSLILFELSFLIALLVLYPFFKFVIKVDMEKNK